MGRWAKRAAHAAVWWTSDVIAKTVVRVLGLFPPIVRAGILEDLRFHRPLDYPAARLVLVMTSRTEQRVRARSVAKEPETVDWIEQTFGAGDVLYDVGANVGAYALIAAHRGQGTAEVYAFEPGARTVASLVDNIVLNHLADRIFVFPVALGERTSLQAFHYATLEAGGARHPGIVDVKGEPSRGPITRIPCFALDDLVSLLDLRPPTHLKLDVDGSELEVLRGAVRTLSDPSLRWVLVEVDRGAVNVAELRGLLAEHGFRLDRTRDHSDVLSNWIFRRETSTASTAEANRDAQ